MSVLLIYLEVCMVKSQQGSDSKFPAFWSGTITVILVALFAWLLSLTNFFQLIELKLYDLNFQFRGPVTLDHSDVVVVAIDQQTTDSLAFPFDRKHYATVIYKLDKLGARHIVFDIDFSSVGISPSSDSLLYEAVLETEKVILSAKIDMRYQTGIKDPIVSMKRPVPQVTPSGTELGLINDIVDLDGTIRNYPLFITARDTNFLSLGLKIYAGIHEFNTDSIYFTESGNFRYGTLEIPSHANFTMLNYYGPAGIFPTYSFIDVLNGTYDFDDLLAGLSEEEIAILAEAGAIDLMEDSPFKDKTVMIGASAEDLQDNKFTPYRSSENLRKTPGVEVHANAVQMLEDGRFISAVSLNWILLTVLIFSLMTFMTDKYLGPWKGLISAVILLIAVSGLGLYLFTRWGIWLERVPLILTIVIGYPTNLVIRVIQTQQEKAMLRGMFGRYLPESVVEHLIANPGQLQLGGERRRMSVLFTDIAGFTTVSEKLEPEELVALLNVYLTSMTNIIQENEGIIDKYEGDLIMAEFGAPVWMEDHAARCCRAALGMQAKLAEMRKMWKKEGKDELESRVGVNTGEMIVGNMGSQKVFDYTVMGDAVNLSSRLEGANKSYGTRIMIGYQTYLDVKNDFVTRPLDFLRVKGKNEPVEVFELVAESDDELSMSFRRALEYFRVGIDLYRIRNFTEAIDCFRQALEQEPNDSPSSVYLSRCENYLITPPEEDWDGAFTLTEK